MVVCMNQYSSAQGSQDLPFYTQLGELTMPLAWGRVTRVLQLKHLRPCLQQPK